MERASRWWELRKTENIPASPKSPSRRCSSRSSNRHRISSWLVVRSKRDPQQLGAAIRSALRRLDPGLPVYIQLEQREWTRRCLARGWRPFAGRAGPDGRDAVDYGDLRHGGVFGQQAAAGVGNSRGPGRAAKGSAAGGVRTRGEIAGFWSAAGLVLGILASRVLAFIVYQATPRDPLVLAGWCWLCCWDCWRRGFRRGGRCRLILCAAARGLNPRLRCSNQRRTQ